MVEINVEYTGSLHCIAKHGPSGMTLETDAPKDNMGKGESFSPTDLAATSLATCILTTMAIAALKHPEIDLTGAKARVLKEMSKELPRRISGLPVTITFARNYSPQQRTLLEKAALTCPVHRSLGTDVKIPLTFVYPD
jgi:putative redox protein